MRLAFLALAWGGLAACGGSTPAPNVEAPAPGSALFNDGDVVAYTVKSGSGALIGRVHSTYRAGENAQVQTRVAIDPRTSGESEINAELVTTLRADGSPVAFKRLSSLDGRYELRFQDRGASVITGEGAREVKYARSPLVLLPRRDLMLLAIALQRSGLAPGTAGKLAVLSPQSVEKLELDARVWNDAAANTIVQLPDAKVTLAANGRIVRVEEADTGFVLDREDPPGDPPRIDPPSEPIKYARPSGAEWSDREVTIDVREGTIAATLSEPRLRANLDQKYAPGVVLLSAGGRRDRHGFGGGIDHGTWQLADRLVDDGFAVLRADDRGAGASVSRLAPSEVGLEVMVEDAKAMVAFMRAQPGVDRERIFVIGHGDGGVLAMLLAARESLAGVVLLATPHRTRLERIAPQDRQVVVMALKGHAAASAQIGPQRLAELAERKQLLIEEGELDLAKTVAAAAKTEAAVFQGMKDFEVSWKDDAKALVDGFKKSGNRRAKLFVYENVDHLMKEEPGASSQRRYLDRSRRVDPRVLDDLSAWLTATAKLPR